MLALLFPESTFSRAAMVNVAVFPVPDCACAIKSPPSINFLIALRWIGEGFSNYMHKFLSVNYLLKTFYQ